MKYAGIIKNDLSAAPGVCLTFFTQGCPHHCHNCHNPETWDFNGGVEFTQKTMNEIITGLNANGILRSLCIMGGEPLAPENELLTFMIVEEAKKRYPNLTIYLWSGYTIEELLSRERPTKVNQILNSCDYLIDGRYDESLRDVSLAMRGSSNQRIIKLKDIDFL